LHAVYLRIQAQTQNMKYLLLFHSNSAYVIRTLPTLLLFTKRHYYYYYYYKRTTE
jgi:hypothetical protein